MQGSHSLILSQRDKLLINDKNLIAMCLARQQQSAVVNPKPLA
jgi:hypothetical protein